MAYLTRLTLSGLRNLADTALTPQAGMTLITGTNGAGKTALLEGIFLLSTGRSFRESRLQRLQQWHSPATTLFAQISNRHGEQRLGWQRQKQETSLRLNGDTARSQAELAWHLPVQVFSPESHDLLTHGPSERRRFIDWGTFYQNPAFLPAWRRYQQALRQRNQALRLGASERELALWTDPLWQAAQIVHQARTDYCQQLTLTAQALAPRISDSLSSLTLSYAPGWSQELTLPDVWQAQLPHDRQLGHTQSGPHRADLKLRVQDRDALALLSRGQQKLLALTLLLAQGQLLQQVSNETPVLLLDDLPAELDSHHRARVLELLPELHAQIFLTATDPRALPLPDSTHWALEQGQLNEGTA